ncbi:hypothetical protein VE03_06896 [Pseudogymnoascus sp. 23342-1-I1]|nr:hypothetical protein VE03_06896 [Pseudogymnoascus sp. 23342-1-I1]
MARLLTLSLALLALLTPLTTASALPELRPNAPRLESINLTTPNYPSHTFNGPPPPPPPLPLPPTTPNTLATLEDDFNTCDTIQLSRASILDGINFLIALGGTPCVVGQQSVVFVTKGNVAITGYNGLMVGETSAPCHDVGMAVRWIVEHCAMGDMAFGGTTTARGKKEVVIRVRRA